MNGKCLKKIIDLKLLTVTLSHRSANLGSLELKSWLTRYSLAENINKNKTLKGKFCGKNLQLSSYKLLLFTCALPLLILSYFCYKILLTVFF